MRKSTNLIKIERHYDSLFLKFKDSYKTAQQSSKETQEKRMEILIDGFNFHKKDRILDFGCGTAHLYNYLIKKKKFKGFYTGIDISKKIIEFNKKKFEKNKKTNFINQNILIDDTSIGTYDYVFISGTFNNRTENSWSWMKTSLKKVFFSTKKVLAFNNLSYYVDFYDKNLYYVKPEKVFSFCKKNLSKYVKLRNDYQVKKGIMPFEFTTYVFKKN